MLKEKLIIFFRRISEATPSCLFVMAQGNLKVITLAHWEIALRTGAITGAVMVLLSFIEPRKWLHNRYTTGALTGAATAASDFVAHPAAISGEAILTGIVAAVLCIFYSFIVKESKSS
jgi:ammonia channel protein AmtB